MLISQANNDWPRRRAETAQLFVMDFANLHLSTPGVVAWEILPVDDLQAFWVVI